MVRKFGFKNVDEMKKEGQKKFSLIETGIAQRPSCRLLLLNVWNPPSFKQSTSLITLGRG